jgi:hypothetical protein
MGVRSHRLQALRTHRELEYLRSAYRHRRMKRGEARRRSRRNKTRWQKLRELP